MTNGPWKINKGNVDESGNYCVVSDSAWTHRPNERRRRSYRAFLFHSFCNEKHFNQVWTHSFVLLTDTLNLHTPRFGSSTSTHPVTCWTTRASTILYYSKRPKYRLSPFHEGPTGIFACTRIEAITGCGENGWNVSIAITFYWKNSEFGSINEIIDNMWEVSTIFPLSDKNSFGHAKYFELIFGISFSDFNYHSTR